MNNKQWFPIFEFPRYAITTDGLVMNTESGEMLSGSVNPDGYHNFRLTNPLGVVITVGRHRLLAATFKHPGVDIDNMVVNHLNGIKGNDYLDNLEWTTYQGNMEHAGLHGLTSKCIPVQIRNVDNGQVTFYPSAKAASEAMGVTKDAILYRLRIGMTRVFPERLQYRPNLGDFPWYIPENVEMELLVNSTLKPVSIKNIITGNVLTFNSITDAAMFLSRPLPTMSVWLSLPNQPVLPGFIQMKFLYDQSDWRMTGDPFVELAAFTKVRPVKVTIAETGEFVVYTTALEAATAHGLKPTALNYRLQNGNGKVFPDGKSYVYYC